jgi:hypothetical protein
VASWLRGTIRRATYGSLRRFASRRCSMIVLLMFDVLEMIFLIVESVCLGACGCGCGRVLVEMGYVVDGRKEVGGRRAFCTVQ